MLHDGNVLVELDGEVFVLPVGELGPYRLAVSDIVPAILDSVGASTDELSGPELEDRLASWKNPVLAFLPQRPDPGA
jgi:hypothetical protein